jgi:hypothetical protein
VKCSSQFYNNNNDDSKIGTNAKTNFLFDNFNTNNNDNYKPLSSSLEPSELLFKSPDKRWGWLNPLVNRQSKLASDHAHRRTRKMDSYLDGHVMASKKSPVGDVQFMPSISVGELFGRV